MQRDSQAMDGCH